MRLTELKGNRQKVTTWATIGVLWHFWVKPDDTTLLNMATSIPLPWSQDLERVIEEAKRQAKIEAHSNLSSETKRIAGDNKRMAKELRFQMQVLLI